MNELKETLFYFIEYKKSNTKIKSKWKKLKVRFDSFEQAKELFENSVIPYEEYRIIKSTNIIW